MRPERRGLEVSPRELARGEPKELEAALHGHRRVTHIRGSCQEEVTDLLVAPIGVRPAVLDDAKIPADPRPHAKLFVEFALEAAAQPLARLRMPAGKVRVPRPCAVRHKEAAPANDDGPRQDLHTPPHAPSLRSMPLKSSPFIASSSQRVAALVFRLRSASSFTNASRSNRLTTEAGSSWCT